MARIKGNKVTFTIDGDDYTPETSSVVWQSEEADSDFVSFADAAAGGSFDEYLEITAVQDLGATSFQSWLLDNRGVEADFVFAPYGNATATANEPHVTGTVIVKAPPSIGGESATTWTFDIRLDLVEPMVLARGV